jgi:hypothetical protein
LHLAAGGGHTEIVKIFLERGAIIDAPNIDQDTALHLAALNGHIATLELLLAQGASIEGMNRSGHTPLHCAATKGHKETVEFLLEQGANIEAISDYKQTLPHHATIHNRQEIVKLLLSKRSNSNAKDNNDRTALDLAKHYNCKENIEWAKETLRLHDYIVRDFYEDIVSTPWSQVCKILTNKGYVFFKSHPSSFVSEASILQFLGKKSVNAVPVVIAIDPTNTMFLMKDCGVSLRSLLKENFIEHYLYKALSAYTHLQQSLISSDIDFLLSLGVPDWRPEYLPTLYKKMLQDEVFLLQRQNISQEHLERLHLLYPLIEEQCSLLAQCGLHATMVQQDFNTNNVCMNAQGEMTCIDLGEIVIAHPFFSFQNFMHTNVIHHGIEKNSVLFKQLKEYFFQQWPNITKDDKEQALELCEKIFPIYCAIGAYYLIQNIGVDAFYRRESNQGTKIGSILRQYIFDQA